MRPPFHLDVCHCGEATIVVQQLSTMQGHLSSWCGINFQFNRTRVDQFSMSCGAVGLWVVLSSSRPKCGHLAALVPVRSLFGTCLLALRYMFYLGSFTSLHGFHGRFGWFVGSSAWSLRWFRVVAVMASCCMFNGVARWCFHPNSALWETSNGSMVLRLWRGATMEFGHAFSFVVGSPVGFLSYQLTCPCVFQHCQSTGNWSPFLVFL